MKVKHAVPMVLLGLTGCASSQVVQPKAVASVQTAAVIALDGNVSLQFEDEPQGAHGSVRIFQGPPTSPPPEVTRRRAEEAEAILLHLETALTHRLGWKTVRPTVANQAWTQLRDETPNSTALQAGAARWLHPTGLPFADSLTRAFGGAVELEPVPDPATPGSCKVPSHPFALGKYRAFEPHEQLARELDVQAFLMARITVDRAEVSGIQVTHAAVPDAQGRLFPVAHAQLLIVDPCGFTIAFVERQAVAKTCALSLASENLDGEQCAIVEAASAAVDAALDSIPNRNP